MAAMMAASALSVSSAREDYGQTSIICAPWSQAWDISQEAGGSSGTDGVMTLRHLTLLMREVGIKNWVTGAGESQRTSVLSRASVQSLQVPGVRRWLQTPQPL